MFTVIIEICERTFFTQQQQQTQLAEIFDEKIYQLPSFIESLACVCSQIDDNLPEGTVLTLEKLVILAIDSYPKLIKRYNHQISLAIARLLISIQLGKFSFYSEFIGRIIYQSMIRIFSYKTNYYMQQEKLGDQNGGTSRVSDIGDESSSSSNNYNEEGGTMERNLLNITSTDYVQFWANLLNLNDFKELNQIVHVNDKQKLVRIIYDELIECFIKIMKKLDLNAVKIDKNEENEPASPSMEQSLNTSLSQIDINVSSNPIIGLRPSRPKDFEILINLVDFSKLVFTFNSFI